MQQKLYYNEAHAGVLVSPHTNFDDVLGSNGPVEFAVTDTSSTLHFLHAIAVAGKFPPTAKLLEPPLVCKALQAMVLQNLDEDAKFKLLDDLKNGLLYPLKDVIGYLLTCARKNSLDPRLGKGIVDAPRVIENLALHIESIDQGLLPGSEIVEKGWNIGICGIAKITGKDDVYVQRPFQLLLTQTGKFLINWMEREVVEVDFLRYDPSQLNQLQAHWAQEFTHMHPVDSIVES